MKTFFLPLILLLTANPALASHGKSPSECFNMYRHYLNDENLSSSKMMNFVDNCIPEKQAKTDEPLSRKLLQIEFNDNKVVTLKI